MKPNQGRYQQAGVDPEKAQKAIQSFSEYLKSQKKDPNLVTGIGPFASLYQLKEILREFQDPLMVTCCDGVGTKLKLAVDWGHTSELGQDLVAMNANDLLCTGARPLVFLDYYACSRLDADQWLEVLKSIHRSCEIIGCTLAGGETAEMPGMYAAKDIDLAGFLVGMVDRPKMIGPHRIKDGDQLVALGSSGFHSNGYSLVRKLIEKHDLKPNEKTPFSDETWKDCLLRPTHLYHPAIGSRMELVEAAAHITGGGLFENLPRILPKGFVARVSSAKWQFSPLYEWLRNTAKLEVDEILSTFNGGVGLILVCRKENTDPLVKGLIQEGWKAWHAGEILKPPSAPTETVEWV